MDMNNNANTTRGGLNLSVTLLVIFVVLKLIKVINWSWWWVISPLWITWAAYLGIALIVTISVAIKEMLFKRKRKRKNK